MLTFCLTIWWWGIIFVAGMTTKIILDPGSYPITRSEIISWIVVVLLWPFVMLCWGGFLVYVMVLHQMILPYRSPVKRNSLASNGDESP